MFSERELIERVGRAFRSHADASLRVGMGDDAAILRPSRVDDWVLTTDAFIEGIHFRLRDPAADAGYKALARAASDLAAKGAQPRFFLMNLALSQHAVGKWLDDFLAGMSAAARRFGSILIGGDTTKNDHVAVNLTLLGTVARGRAVLRSGSRPGDLIFVSGTLGEAALGLRLSGLAAAKRKRWNHLLQRHRRPEPRLALGQTLANRGWASAMIDISDGLSTDLSHLCEASGVGAEIYAEDIPKVQVPAALRLLRLDPLKLALDGGDDYELLFTASPRHARTPARRLTGVSLSRIGKITQGKEILLVNGAGQATPLVAHGWDPFRRH